MAEREGCALIIGGSRGIGAAVASNLDKLGWRVGFTFHKHARRAEKFRKSLSKNCHVFQVDICDLKSIDQLEQYVATSLGQIDVLVLSASGGLEWDKSSDYAFEINVNAQKRLCEKFLPYLVQDGRIVFLTSHEAHFYNQIEPYEPYAPIAITKKAGEMALRQLLPKFAAYGVKLEIVSADIVEGTATAKLLERNDPAHIAKHRAQIGQLPDPEDVAKHIVQTCLSDVDNNANIRTTYVWSPRGRYAGLVNPCSSPDDVTTNATN
ncbi:SDR family oxidoreductase [Sphingorhabdus sp. EL138]|uniref:SDR family oxidoreductase n=1 Tax=Sphingorhabdus sp. EL138 TaxID=2073156 RepID=UPI0013A5A1B0|nr:SDR family oxidoreductase [Sphingorhabdus sp. EL138]